MKRVKKQPKTNDPWPALAQEGALTTIPIEEVLASLRVSDHEADALKKGLLAEINRICTEESGPDANWLLG
jgi:hypothetical protein